MDKYFKPMDSLEIKKGSEVNYADTYFKTPGDLTEENGVSQFRIAGDLVDDNKTNGNKSKIEQINDYLITVVSGEKYPAVCELGVLIGAGIMIVNLKQLKELVESGHNIVSAKVINYDAEMIEIEVQKYKYDKDMMERRSRF